VANKRRLPVIKESEPEDEPKPGWHWIGFGALAIFVAWLPLAYIGEAVSRRLVVGKLGPGPTNLDGLSRAERLSVLAMMAGPQMVALIVAGVGGGFLVTRFGRGTRRRDAAFAGLAVGLLALGLTYAQVGVSLAALVVPCLAAGSAALGGVVGNRRKL
jgi:hypothetical protein